jgi:hypothetical protein
MWMLPQLAKIKRMRPGPALTDIKAADASSLWRSLCNQVDHSIGQHEGVDVEAAATRADRAAALF